MDHKLLIPWFSTKCLEELPIRVQCFRLRMLQYDFTFTYEPGKNMTIADALSRAPVTKPDEHDKFLQEETSAYMDCEIESLLATERRLEQIRIS